jgi:methyl-accepting chemotaxis protein
MRMMMPGSSGVGSLAAAVGVRAVSVEVEQLQTFKSRVDRMLADLDSSAASPKEIADQQLTADHLGSGFGEAGDLAKAYNTVHSNLQQLSKTLADQIEAMSITVDASNRGYQNVDEEQLHTLWTIHDRTDASYKAHGPAGSTGGPVSAPTTTGSGY